MLTIARIVGVSLLAAWLAARIGVAYFGHYEDYSIPCLLLACAGGIVGAVAGAALEMVIALRRRPSS